MSDSPVGICRGALHRIGDTSTISSIENPSTVEEKLCAEEYDDVRRELLRSHVWNFAKKRVKISAETTDPIFGYGNAYKLPADYLRVVQIGSWVTDVLYTDYTIEGNLLLLNYSPDDSASSTDPAILNFVYIFDQTDVSQWDSIFKQMAKLRLAEKLFPLHKKNTLMASIQEEVTIKMPKARSVDGQDKPPARIERSRILESRGQSFRGSNKYQGFYFGGP